MTSARAHSTDLAPIALFCYRRPDHLRRTLAALRRCGEFAASPLYVYCDGAASPMVEPDVAAVRELLRHELPASANLILRDRNLGLAANIVDGVGALCAQYGRVVVLEDDLVVSPDFLTFMNEGLRHYAEESRVFQIAAHTFDAAEGVESAYFLPITTSWGWATWQRSWRHFDPKASGWQRLLRDTKLRWRFNFNGSYDYSTMLFRYFLGHNDSWAVRWNWAVFANGGLVLYPPRNLASNIGMDGSGTHGRGLFRRHEPSHVPWTAAGADTMVFPVRAEIDLQDVERISQRLRRISGTRAIRTFDTLRALYIRWRVRQSLARV